LRIVLALLIALAGVNVARADGFSAVAPLSMIPIPSTPDISIIGTATTEYVFDLVQGPVDWVGIKNDCANSIWFSLTPGEYSDARQFSLRLEPTESFAAPMRLSSIAASGDGANTCTFTLQLGKWFR
ncbi:hypothetical protein LCGC14_1552840, partial [marine sediment metagenome]